MGCCSSRPTGEDVELATRHPQQITVSEPTGGPILVPPPYRDQSGRPIQHSSSDLDSNTLRAALDDMALFLSKRKVQAQLVTVGGAVNTLYLRSRPSTHDVDFFLQDATSSTHRVIHEAARHANRRRGGRLGAEWLNNATQLFMSAQMQKLLFDDAVKQGSVVYQRDGLTVYAAPWSYALCGKLDRLCGSDPRPYDLADAIAYLHEHFRTKRVASVGAQEIRRWCDRFDKKVADSVLTQLDDAYRVQHGRGAIDWRT